jgi:hypothetical protein
MIFCDVNTNECLEGGCVSWSCRSFFLDFAKRKKNIVGGRSTCISRLINLRMTIYQYNFLLRELGINLAYNPNSPKLSRSLFNLQFPEIVYYTEMLINFLEPFEIFAYDIVSLNTYA